MFYRIVISAFSVCCFLSVSLSASEIRVAVAANFHPVIREIAEVYERDTGQTISIISGSSGKLAAQIIQNAPFDLFLSADIARAEFLEEQGRIIEGTRVTYARGRLVIAMQEQFFTAKQATEQEIGQILSPLQRLEQSQFSQLAMANPSLAPYGFAASQAIEKMGLELGREKRIYGENISQAFHFFRLGRTDLAFLGLSQVLDVAMSSEFYEEIPAEYYSPIEQQMVVLKRFDRRALDTAHHQTDKSQQVGNVQADSYKDVMRFYDYLLSEGVQTQISQQGYFSP